MKHYKGFDYYQTYKGLFSLLVKGKDAFNPLYLSKKKDRLIGRSFFISIDLGSIHWPILLVF